MEPRIVALKVDDRQRTERSFMAMRYEMLSRLLKLIEASIDILVEGVEEHAVLLESAFRISPTATMYEGVWYHYSLSGTANDGDTPHTFYYLRIPDGMITRLVVETQPNGTEVRFTVKVDLNDLTVSEIGMFMAEINTLVNTR